MSDIWKEFMQELAFNNGVSALLIVLSKPELSKKFEPAFKKIYRLTNRVFPHFKDDPTLQ